MTTHDNTRGETSLGILKEYGVPVEGFSIEELERIAKLGGSIASSALERHNSEASITARGAFRGALLLAANLREHFPEIQDNPEIADNPDVIDQLGKILNTGTAHIDAFLPAEDAAKFDEASSDPIELVLGGLRAVHSNIAEYQESIKGEADEDMDLEEDHPLTSDELDDIDDIGFDEDDEDDAVESDEDIENAGYIIDDVVF